ncbi:unnamed protein product [Caenorhabditis angaria]|uniref:Neurotransmitter-gated ion-channel ligand-binding domain-containing protein n=1 Tax=Caenorhabditis angaria TaxID=860376 RepID=A0A9P1IBK5_9PELO|nr:unnamed protein product [Caenorhabditis angaria]
MKLVWLIFLLFLIFVRFGVGEDQEEDQEDPDFLIQVSNETVEYERNSTYPDIRMVMVDKFMEDLFKGYDKEAAPISENRKHQWPFEYEISVLRFKLIDVDEPKEQVTVVMEIQQAWPDDRLTWDPEEHDNVTAVYLRLEKLWSPPITVFFASEVTEQRDQNFRMAKAIYNGYKVTHVPMKITFNCKLQMHNFPFDTQICEIRMGLPSVKTKLFFIRMILSQNLQKNLCSLGNSAWDIVNITAGSENVKSLDFSYDSLKMGVMKIHLKRNPTFYLYMIVLPTFIINSISIAGVFLKNTDKIDRLTIGLTHIMTMTFILGIIADKLPKTEHVPLLGQYIIFGLCTMIVAMTFSTYLKKISENLSVRLMRSRSGFCQKLRKFIGKPLRVLSIIFFQIINIIAVVYILSRYIHFENKYGFETPCTAAAHFKDMEFHSDDIGEDDCGCY